MTSNIEILIATMIHAATRELHEMSPEDRNIRTDPRNLHARLRDELRDLRDRVVTDTDIARIINICREV